MKPNPASNLGAKITNSVLLIIKPSIKGISISKSAVGAASPLFGGSGNNKSYLT